MAWSLIQQPTGTANSSPLSVTISATGAGRLLGFAAYGAGGTFTPTTPSGWTLRQNPNTSLYFWEKVNAGSISTFSLSWTGGADIVLGQFTEWSGGATAGQPDAGQNKTGTGTTWTTTATGALTGSSDLALAYFGSNDGVTNPNLTTPTNGFTLLNQVTGDDTVNSNSNFPVLRGSYLFKSDTLSVSTGVTSSRSDSWGSLIVAYLAAAAGEDAEQMAMRVMMSQPVGGGNPYAGTPASAMGWYCRRPARRRWLLPAPRPVLLGGPILLG